tara:strand:+ start:1693 stop:2922 length:1230 start_codon:yes stop_codon:yes gene_type:complete
MSKNTHLEHLEDSIILDGQSGAKDAFIFLDDLARSFSGKSTSNFTVTTKWDGAPAVFCGLYPGSKSFFVGTKSVFNVQSKINFTPDDVKRNHGHAPGLVEKLEASLTYLPSLGIKGIAQGDLLFTNDKKTEIIDGVRHITFKPNTITYAIPEGDELYDKAKKAKLGIVFHTSYTGTTISSMNASFGYDVSKLNESSDVLVLSAEIGSLGKNVLLTEVEKNKLIRLKQNSNRLLSGAGSFLDLLASQIEANDQLTVGPRLKIFFNKYVREGRSVPSANIFVKEFTSYFETELKKAADKVKTPKAKATKLAKLYAGVQIIEDNISALKNTAELYKVLQSAKEMFITKLETGERIGTYLRTEDGLEATSPEGYVAIKMGHGATKLVKRLNFSQANFKKDTLPTKDWVSGNGS